MVLQHEYYRNVFDEVTTVEPGRVVVDGRSTCSVDPLDGPARWHAVVVDGRLAEWRVEDPGSPG